MQAKLCSRKNGPKSYRLCAKQHSVSLKYHVLVSLEDSNTNPPTLCRQHQTLQNNLNNFLKTDFVSAITKLNKN